MNIEYLVWLCKQEKNGHKIPCNSFYKYMLFTNENINQINIIFPRTVFTGIF